MTKESLFEKRTFEMRRKPGGQSLPHQGWEGYWFAILKNVKDEKGAISGRALKIDFQYLDFILNPMGKFRGVFSISTANAHV